MHPKVRINPDRCDGCGACLSHCPKGPAIFEIVESDDDMVCEVLDPGSCLGCTHCLAHCKRGAISINDGLER
ncbi:ferredoxin [Methanosarcinales archaeon ex4484_138]|nr:MAG: ferredoxin [Methanosarcinales archaeon ex4484_138]RLG26279.1 MAG: ferredoxin [Methanosarcinales archaeon]HHI30368.1 4Fe-4S dicluster domain-containing protein [Candidatus Methanoperedenaceae archaeon]